MSCEHHGHENEAAMRCLMDEFTGTAERQWPHGRISGDDDGKTAFAMAADPIRKVVIIKFTKPMDWIGLDEISARKMALLLVEKADQLSAQSISSKG